jgi:ATP-dependent Clp endopeptidase proteolytic subunit ClpP
MKWFDIKNKADKAEIWIYEMIGEDFWTGGGVTAKSFQKELSEIKASQIDLHINSPGGVVFDGITIHNLIKQHPANVTTYIDGLAASIASVIALAGDKVIMAANALYMVHNPTGLAMGTASDMRSLADVLDKVAGTMVGTYVGKTGKPDAEIRAMLDAETWMTADEALEHGFIDEISEEMDMAACAKFIPIMAKAGFKHVPQSINGKKEIPSPKKVEQALRDAGFSRKAAKSILAKGYSDDLRDAGTDDDPPPVADPPRDAETPKPARKGSVDELLIQAARITA